MTWFDKTFFVWSIFVMCLGEAFFSVWTLQAAHDKDWQFVVIGVIVMITVLFVVAQIVFAYRVMKQ